MVVLIIKTAALLHVKKGMKDLFAQSAVKDIIEDQSYSRLQVMIIGLTQAMINSNNKNFVSNVQTVESILPLP